MTTATHPCDGFFSEAAKAFDRIARGVPPDCPDAILEALVANNLIRRTVRVMGRDSQGPLLQYGYAMASELRSQWELFAHQPCQTNNRSLANCR